MICPECQAPEDELDFWLGDGGIWHWNCFGCGHEWTVSQEKMREEIDNDKKDT